MCFAVVMRQKQTVRHGDRYNDHNPDFNLIKTK